MLALGGLPPVESRGITRMNLCFLRRPSGLSSVVLHKYLAHKGINAYIGVHGYNDQEVATATG